MIERLLIANRGEIAVRVARTCAQLGIETVGVYSEPDRRAVHVGSVDLAVALGGTTAADSYLRGDHIIATAKAHGCDAIHPGYGFLAENADFAQAVIDAGLIWVGPAPDQIRLLGDKKKAKHAAIDAGVPTTTLIECAPGMVPSAVPMPAVVKAASGGGGRGMRIVRERDDLEAAVESAAREAEAAFGDGAVFIEPYIDGGRHIEVQIFGDAHGNVVHLGERDCSIQRRNQKVVEEAPAPGIDAATRAALCDGAVALARSVGYQNAGTVEFLVGDDGEITFLEVNTRLQVEHPVTEAVTGLDLVGLQLIVADGQPLPISQDDVRISGHAVEVRVVAEDPEAHWMPSTGRISFSEFAPGLRVDSGFAAGSEVSVHYDSLLAKVISHGPTREVARRRLAAGLRQSLVSGVRTNLSFLARVMVDPDFTAGGVRTNYLASGGPDDAASSLGDSDALLLGAVFADQYASASKTPLPFAPSGWRNVFTSGQRQHWESGQAGDDRLLQTELLMCHDTADVLLGSWPEPTEDGTLGADERRRVAVRILHQDSEAQVLEIDGVRHDLRVRIDDGTAHVRSAYGSESFTLQPRFTDHDPQQSGAGPVCPLPGTVIAVNVAAGDSVTEGQVLVVVEAMKMEHQITASADGTVVEVLFSTGDRVGQGDLLVQVEGSE